MFSGRFWCLFFLTVAAGFIVDTYLVVQGKRRARMWLFDVLFSLSMVFPIWWMLGEEGLSAGEKAIASITALICAIASTVHIIALLRNRCRKGHDS